MHIALFVETYLPYINGVVTHVKQLKDGLEALGHRVMVVTADPKVRHHHLVRGVLHCPAASMKRFYDYGFALPLSRTRLSYLKRFQPDVIHIHTEFSIGVSGVAIAKQLRVPLVSTVHTMYDDYLYYLVPDALVPALKTASHSYFRMIVKNADEITGPSPKVQQFLSTLGIEKQVHVIPNPVEVDAFSSARFTEEERRALRRDLGIPENAWLGCFVGRLGREKSVDVLLNMFAEQFRGQEGFHLCVVGDGPVRSELIEQAEALGISDLCHFPGKVMHAALPPYLAACDYYVTTSLSDTNSISMLEGMAAGLPVLHIRDELNRGQVVDGKNGFVFQDSAELGRLTRMLRDMPKEDLFALRRSAVQSVAEAGGITLARNLLPVYAAAMAENHNRRRWKRYGER